MEDLPDPVLPIMPIVSPGAAEKLMPSMAGSRPSGKVKDTPENSTLPRGAFSSGSALPQSLVEL